MRKIQDRCFCWFPAAIYVPVKRTPTWCLYIYINYLGKTFSRISFIWNVGQSWFLEGVFYIYFLSCPRFWTFCIRWFAFFYFWWHDSENRENLIDYSSNLFFAMLTILYSALFVAGWIFVNNSHKFSFDTVEFWKNWSPLLSNLAGKGGHYFKVAVTTSSAIQLLYFALKSWGYQQSNISNIHLGSSTSRCSRPGRRQKSSLTYTGTKRKNKQQKKTTLGTHKPEVDMQYPQYFCCSKAFLLHASC